MMRRKRAKNSSATRASTRRRLGVEPLEVRRLLAANPVINEFLAENRTSIVDEDGDSSDWVEILNAGDMAVNLAGWHLTDDPGDLDKWTFPSTNLAAGQYLVVFASGKDRAGTGPAGRHHDCQPVRPRVSPAAA